MTLEILWQNNSFFTRHPPELLGRRFELQGKELFLLLKKLKTLKTEKTPPNKKFWKNTQETIVKQNLKMYIIDQKIYALEIPLSRKKLR